MTDIKIDLTNETSIPTEPQKPSVSTTVKLPSGEIHKISKKISWTEEQPIDQIAKVLLQLLYYYKIGYITIGLRERELPPTISGEE